MLDYVYKRIVVKMGYVPVGNIYAYRKLLLGKEVFVLVVDYGNQRLEKTYRFIKDLEEEFENHSKGIEKVEQLVDKIEKL